MGDDLSTMLYLHRVNSSCLPDAFQTWRRVEYLERAGYIIVDDPAAAGAILILCCDLDMHARDNTLRAIRAMQTYGKPLLIGGCITAVDVIAAEQIAEAVGARVFHTYECSGHCCDYLQIQPAQATHEHIKEIAYWNECRSLYAAAAEASISAPLLRAYLRWCYSYSDTLALIEVGRGCANSCTYCADRFIRNGLRSRLLPEVMISLHAALRDCLFDIAFVADDLAAYGLDMGSSFLSLMEHILATPHDMAIYLDNCNPEHLLALNRAALCEVVSDRRVKYITVPIQSIHRHLLSRMGRRYAPEDALDLISAMKGANPDLVVCTHVLVGFPGETDADFEELRTWVTNSPLDIVECFDYQEHPRTTASDLTGQVDARTRSERKSVIDGIFYDALSKERELVLRRCCHG